MPWRCSADRCSIDRLKVHFHGQGNLPSAKAIKEVRFRGTWPPVALRPISPGLTVPRAASSSVPVPRLHTQTATEQRFGWGRYKVKWGAWRAITTHVGRPDKQHPGCTSLLLQAPLPDPSRHPLPGGCLPEIASTTAPPSCLEGSDAAHLGRVLPTDPLGCPPPPTPVPMSCCCRVTSPAVPGRGGPAGPAGRFGFMGRELAALAGLRSVRAGPSWTVEDAEPRRGASLNLLTATWAAGQPDRLRGGPRETLPRPGEAKAAPGTCRSCCILLACIFEEYFRCRGT